MTLDTVRRVRDLRERVGAWRRQGLRVGLVPTMGALHAGHLSLVERALQLSDRVVATIFVNPRQFGPAEDLAAYPRQEAADAALLDAAGAHLLFAPPVDEVYPEGFATTVTVTGVSEGLCGAARPGHFAGVATVVTKLLLQALPDIAMFGEKDWQQLQVIRRLVRDLDIPVVVEGAPTLREPDGLAMSSRNAYLGPDERARAPRLYQILSQVAAELAQGAAVAERTAWAVAELERAGFAPVDYVEARDADTLAPVGERVTRPARLLAAARLGRARLIDNVAVAVG